MKIPRKTRSFCASRGFYFNTSNETRHVLFYHWATDAFDLDISAVLFHSYSNRSTCSQFQKKKFGVISPIFMWKVKNISNGYENAFQVIQKRCDNEIWLKKKTMKAIFCESRNHFLFAFFFFCKTMFIVQQRWSLNSTEFFFSKESLIINIKLNCILLEFGAFSHGSRHFCLIVPISTN